MYIYMYVNMYVCMPYGCTISFHVHMYVSQIACTDMQKPTQNTQQFTVLRLELSIST